MKLPSEFEARTLEWMGEETYRALEAALQTESPVSIRVNRTKWSGEVAGEPVLWASAGVYLSQRPTFTFDPLFHAGCYYVQEASSMFVEQVLRTYITGPVVMLDLCAAPGGKSTHARSVLPVGSLLVANEVMRNRSQVLAENLIKWGNAEVVVTNNDPADFTSLTEVFDVVLADVPCSGEGMFRKDPVAVEEWSTDNVQVCWQRQRRILADIWPALKPGGLLIYSTCTYNREEDEENVAWIADELGAEILKVPVASEWGIIGNLAGQDFPVYRFLPHRVEVRGTKVIAFPNVHLSEYDLFRQELKVVHAGVTIGELKGKDVIPDHSLAMSTLLNHDGFSRFELTYEQAIAYLRKEAITLDASVPRGYILLTYKNIPLGFAKNIGNRANNLYPQEWRIRSGYLPEELSFVC